MKFNERLPVAPCELPTPSSNNNDADATDYVNAGGSPTQENSEHLLSYYESGKMGISALVRRGLLFYAKRIDDARQANGKDRIMELTLAGLISPESKEASESFFVGYNCGIQVPIIRFFARDSIRSFEKTLIDNDVDTQFLYRPFIQIAIADGYDTEDKLKRFSHWQSFADDIEEASVPDNVRAYLYLVKLSNTVRGFIRDRIEARISKSATIDILGSPADFWQRILFGTSEPGKAGKEGIFMALGYLKRIGELRDKCGLELFGQESASAKNAAQDLVYMRTSKAIRSLYELRVPALIFFGRREIDRAIQSLGIVKTYYPDVLAAAATENLQEAHLIIPRTGSIVDALPPYIYQVRAILTDIPQAQRFLAKLAEKNEKRRKHGKVYRLKKLQSEQLDATVAAEQKEREEREFIINRARKIEYIARLAEYDFHRGHVLVGLLDSPFGEYYHLYFIGPATQIICRVSYLHINEAGKFENKELFFPKVNIRKFKVYSASSDAVFHLDKVVSYFDILTGLYEKNLFDNGLMGDLSEAYSIPNGKKIAEQIRNLKP